MDLNPTCSHGKKLLEEQCRTCELEIEVAALKRELDLREERKRILRLWTAIEDVREELQYLLANHAVQVLPVAKARLQRLLHALPDKP